MDNFIRQISRIKNKITKSDFEILLHKTTSNEFSFPTDQELKYIARESYRE